MKNLAHLEPMDYLRIPWKRRWYFLSVMVLVLAGSLAYAWLRPSVYQSETRIIVESTSVLDEATTPYDKLSRTEAAVIAIRQLLESRSILDRIIEEFRLRAGFTNIPQEDALIAVKRSLIVSKPLGNTFTIAYLATDPQAAQQITRRLAEILIQTSQTLQKNRAIDKDQFLEQELRQAELQLTAVDDKIRDFKKRNLGALPEQGAANMNALNGLHSQLIAIDNTLDRARDQQKLLEFRLEEQSKLNDLARSIPPKEKPAGPEPRRNSAPTMLTTQLMAKRAQLAEMTARYTARHPDVVRLTKEVEDLELQLAAQDGTQPAAGNTAQLTPLSPDRPTSEIVNYPGNAQANSGAESEIAQVKYELTTLKETTAKREKERENVLQNINVYQARLNLAPSLEQELLTLTREHETIRQQAASLQTRKFNAQMAANAVADRKNDTFRILDEASLPDRPMLPTRLQIVLMGIAGSIGAGLGAAFLREISETSITNEDEAAIVFKLPILASIPEIPAEPRALKS